MASQIPALLQIVCSTDDERPDEVTALAAALGVSERTARTCCRRLRAVIGALDAANDDAHAPNDAEWLSTARLGARLLTVEAEPAVAAAASRLLRIFDGGDDGARKLADDALRSRIVRAVTERRVLLIEYWNPDVGETTTREVEPLTLSNVEGHWTFLAFCRTRRDLRSFRFDRVRDATVTEHHFEARQGLSLERFIHKQKNLGRQRVAV